MGTSAYTFGFITLKIWPSRPKKPYVPDGPLKAILDYSEQWKMRLPWEISIIDI